MSDQSEAMPATFNDRGTGWFVPWKTDSLELLTEAVDRNESLTRLRVIRPAGMDDFLGKPTANAQVVVGARGAGKSLVLAMKAATIREQAGKRLVALMPEHPFINRLSRADVRLPMASISVYADHTSWMRIWMLLLGSVMAFVVLKKEDIPHDPREDGDRIEFLVSKFFGCQPAKSVDRPGPFEFFVDVGNRVFAGNIEVLATLLQHLIRLGLTGGQCQDWFEQYVFAVLARGSTEILYVAYVDGIDEMLADSEGGALFPSFEPTGEEIRTGDASDNSLQLAGECWLAAQTGFADCIETLRERSLQRIRIFGAVRQEVVARYLKMSSLGPAKAKARMLELKYSPQELKGIFDLNVEFTEKKVNPLGATSAEQLYGFDTMESTVVWNYTETILQHMLRHTFGSPRQLILVAGAAKDAVLERPDAPRVPTIVAAVNRAAHTVLAEYKQAVLPKWASSFDKGISKIPFNVLTPSQAADVERMAAVGARYPVDHFKAVENWRLFPFLYARGLIGLPVAGPAGEVELEFLEPDGTERSFGREFEYLALHPALSAEICGDTSVERRRRFYVGDFVVGNKLPAPRAIEKKRCAVQFDRTTGLRLFVDSKEIRSHSPKGQAAQPFLVIAAMLLAIRQEGIAWVPLTMLEQQAKALLLRLKDTALAAAVPSTRVGSGREQSSLLVQIRRSLDYRSTTEQPRLVKNIKAMLGEVGIHWAFQRGDPPSFALEWEASDKNAAIQSWVAKSVIEVRLF